MSAFDFDPDDLDEDDLEALAEMSDEDLDELYEGPDPGDPLAGYARPANRPQPEVDPRRGVDTLPPLDGYAPPNCPTARNP